MTEDIMGWDRTIVQACLSSDSCKGTKTFFRLLASGPNLFLATNRLTPKVPLLHISTCIYGFTDMNFWGTLWSHWILWSGVSQKWLLAELGQASLDFWENAAKHCSAAIAHKAHIPVRCSIGDFAQQHPFTLMIFTESLHGVRHCRGFWGIVRNKHSEWEIMNASGKLWGGHTGMWEAKSVC